MISGIGVDIIENNRFRKWGKYSPKVFYKVFTKQEYINGTKNGFSLQFFASRFAAKEAFYKALSQALFQSKKMDKKFSFLSIANKIEIIKNEWNIPELKIDFNTFSEISKIKLPEFSTQLSISHESKVSIAFVVITLAKTAIF